MYSGFSNVLSLLAVVIVTALTVVILRSKPIDRHTYRFGDEYAWSRRLSLFNMFFGPVAIVLALRNTGAMEIVSLTAAVLFYFAGLVTMRYFHPRLRFKRTTALYLNYASVIFGICVLIFNHYSFVGSIPHINFRDLSSFVGYLPGVAVVISFFALRAIKSAPQE